MIHRDVAVYKVSPEKWISAGGLNRLEQHNRECTRIGRELARMSSLYNAQDAPGIEGGDSLPCGRLQSFIRANPCQFASIRGRLLVQLALGSQSNWLA